jgi:hypothetical protein
MTITIERYETPKVDMFKYNGDFVGIINNEHEFNKVRIQIVRELVHNDYYFMWGNIKITLDQDGNMSDFTVGLYDQVRIDLAELFRITRERKKER